jgi:hypothetical protein
MFATGIPTFDRVYSIPEVEINVHGVLVIFEETGCWIDVVVQTASYSFHFRPMNTESSVLIFDIIHCLFY